MSDLLSQELFSESRLFTLPAGADFLGELAHTLIEITKAREFPEQLGDALIFVPNRRSARALAARLYQELATPGFLPPDIRPLGDAGDNDPALLGELANIDVRPSMPSGARLGALAKPVLAWHKARGEDLTLASGLAVARDLARLLDQAALAGEVDWESLPLQVQDKDLAAHWQVSVEFLEIITQAWPEVLAENGYADTHDQDRLAAEAMCARWARTPPETPVIIAGSTGTSPATRQLMSAALDLPRGAVLFPGLDHDTDAATWHAIGQASSHPQFAFNETLQALGADLSHVRLWPGHIPDERLAARRKLVQEALAPADTTADWVTRLKARAAPDSPEQLTEKGLQGLSLIEAETESEEADAIALLMRETLETPDKTAALITPGAGLARRVCALLERWHIHVSPSAGRPLPQTSAGQFFMHALDWALDPGDPVALACLLKTERIVLPDEDERERAISVLERGVLRGLRRWQNLEEMADFAVQKADYAKKHPTRVTVSEDDLLLAMHLVEDLNDRFGALLERFADLIAEPFNLRPACEQLAELADALSKHKDVDGPSMLWSGSDGAALARYLEDLAFMGDWMPELTQDDLRPLITQLASDIRVPDDQPSHPRLNIWGPLEARLQTCDRIILSGLNEGTWPEQPGTDGFLPRHIRSAIGLPDTEARIGLSAHDFAQFACTPEVILTRSLRVNDKPAVASRWLWRLRILASGALGSLEATDALLMNESAHVLAWAREQNKARSAAPVKPPEPRPPLHARPDHISVTAVETLIRDPYAYYAGTVLDLTQLDPIGAPLSPLAIGNALHEALEGTDTRDNPYITADQLVEKFNREMTLVGADPLFLAEREQAWLDLSAEYIDWLSSRDDTTSDRKFEISYEMDLTIADQVTRLYGRADLVETQMSGNLVIVDFKTGRPRSSAQVISGLSPQLPLLGAMAMLSVEEGKPAAPPSEFFYIGFGSGGGVNQILEKRKPVDAEALSKAALSGLKDLLTSFANEDMPYLSGPRIQFQYSHGEYDGLSRKQEWADPGHEGMEAGS